MREAYFALAYAAWDFASRAGYRDLSGLVLVDGGVHDAFAGEGDVYRLSVQDAADRLQQRAGQYATAALSAPSELTLDLEAIDAYGRTPAAKLSADPRRNTMMRSVVPFLRRLGGR